MNINLPEPLSIMIVAIVFFALFLLTHPSTFEITLMLKMIK